MKTRPMALMTSARLPFLVSTSAAPRPGVPLRIVRRPDQPRRALDEDQRFLLIPGVVAERDGVGAGVDQFLVDRLGDAETAGGVLAVDDDEIERPVADHARQMFGDRGAPRPADDIADEKNTQDHDSPEIEGPRSPLAHNPARRRAAARERRRFPAAAKARPSRDRPACAAQELKRAVVIAGAIADPVAAAVERGQRHQQDVGDPAPPRIGGGSRIPSGPGGSASPNDQARNTSGWPRAMTTGRASRAPCSGEPAHQRERIELAADRRIAGHHRARRDGERKPARGDRLGGAAARQVQRVARASALARSPFDGGGRHMRRYRSPSSPAKAGDPVSGVAAIEPPRRSVLGTRFRGVRRKP